VLGEAATFSEHLGDKHEFQAHSQEGSVHSMLHFKDIPVFQETLLLLLPLLSTSFLGPFPYPKLGKGSGNKVTFLSWGNSPYISLRHGIRKQKSTK